jgi:hypothetical protein
MLELQTLKEIAQCYRLLDEKEKLARVAAQIASFEEEKEEDEDGDHEEERTKHFKEMLHLAEEMGEKKEIEVDLAAFREKLDGKPQKVIDCPKNRRRRV